MSDDSYDPEGFKILDGEGLDDEFAAPGRSVFGDDDVSFDGDDDVIPHWSEPATGAVPQIGGADSTTFQPSAEPQLAEAAPDELAAWADVSSSPRWADEDNFADAPAPVGAVDAGDGPDAVDDFFSFEEPVRTSRLGSASPQPAPVEQSLGAALGAVTGSAASSDRDMPMAIVVGVGLAALILAAMAVGPVAALVVVTVALTLGAVEFFNAVRVAGYQPAVLLGLTAVLTLPFAVYWRGEAAIGLVLALCLVFGSLWYITGVSSDGVVRGLGATMLGIVHIGVLGSFAGLMLSIDTYGTGLLTTAILLTVAYDVGGLAIGKMMGRTPLSPASPNKTFEGLFGGMAATLAAAIAMGVMGSPAPLAGDAVDGGGMTR